MKTKFYICLGIAALALTLHSCKDDDPAGPSSGGTSASMTAKVDGVNWAALSSKTSAATLSGTSNLSGIAADSSMITITITDPIEDSVLYDMSYGSSNAGVYSISTSGSVPAWTSNSDPSCTGWFVLTKLDTAAKLVSGMFEFYAWRGSDNTYRNITEGTFTNVKYSTTVTGGGTNTFAVKIDGVNFAPALIIGSTSLGDLHITASDNAGSKSVGLVMPETVTPGTYAIGSFGDSYYAQYNPNSSTFSISTTGSLTISSHNTTTNSIVGTFYFTSEPFGGGPPTYQITNGSFSISY